MNIHLLKQCLLLPVLLLLPAAMAFGQQYHTENATASFEVQAPAKTIQGISEAVSIRIDQKRGTVALRVPVRSFRFHNNFVSDTLNHVIGERFNTHYMESDRFPMILYTGDLKKTDKRESDRGPAAVFRTNGTLTLHGMQRQVSVEATLDKSSGQMIIHADIVIKPADWGIRIPSYIGDMYFRAVRIAINGTLKNTGNFPKAK